MITLAEGENSVSGSRLFTSLIPSLKKQALWTDEDKTESRSTQTGMMNNQNM